MTTVRMLELVLLNQLNNHLNSLSTDKYIEFTEKYDMKKLITRSKELTDEYLKPYVNIKA